MKDETLTTRAETTQAESRGESVHSLEERLRRWIQGRADRSVDRAYAMDFHPFSPDCLHPSLMPHSYCVGYAGAERSASRGSDYRSTRGWPGAREV